MVVSDQVVSEKNAAEGINDEELEAQVSSRFIIDPPLRVDAAPVVNGVIS